MSLALIQGYSSAEEEAEETVAIYQLSDDDGDEEDDYSAAAAIAGPISYKPVADHPALSPGSSSGLPSAFDAFSEISGPPQFLNNCVEENTTARDIDQGKHGRWKKSREKKDLPARAVMEAKAQLVGIHDRVRSDIEAKQSPIPSVPNATQGGGKRVSTATNPNAEDAADLLRMCVQCGIPKTYSSARGMVCPVCGDRPLNDHPEKELKNKGSTIKDKEKSKRMKGQSSHATWKSETEMVLRQQFD